MAEAPSKSSSDKIFNLGEQEMAQSKQNKRAACPKDKPEYWCFFKPCFATLCGPQVLNFDSLFEPTSVSSGYSLIRYLGMCQGGKSNSPILHATSWNYKHSFLCSQSKKYDVVACSDVTFIIMGCMELLLLQVSWAAIQDSLLGTVAVLSSECRTSVLYTWDVCNSH